MQVEPAEPLWGGFYVECSDREVSLARISGIKQQAIAATWSRDVFRSIEQSIYTSMVFSLHSLAGYCAGFSA
jgi:hypothetical protein